mmetsp:Transcript_79763/g.159269  ORF Transcript_79763/g.159269 Transcript_79763/m.159269 type:complete len:236 (+) Transcript_79763:140-847(+)
MFSIVHLSTATYHRHSCECGLSGALQTRTRKLFQSQSLITPSQPAVATHEGSRGCHWQSMRGPSSWHRKRRSCLHDFQSHTNRRPSPSPDAINLPLGLNVIWHAKPALVCPLNTFLRMRRNRSRAPYTWISFSMLCAAKCCSQGWSPVLGMACISGSLMYFMGTGMPHSHTKIFLSSDVDTKRFPSSQNSTEFTWFRWWLYSWTVSPVFRSHCHSRLSLLAATNTLCSLGWNRAW